MKQRRFFNIVKFTAFCALIFVQVVCALPYLNVQASGETSVAYGSTATPAAEASSGMVMLSVDQPEDNGSACSQIQGKAESQEGSTGEETIGEGDGIGEDTPTGVLALWINGERVVQTPQQVAAWEKGLYACKSEEEYNAYLANVAYYNKGVDMNRFEWTWDEMKEIYTDEQIELLKKDSNAEKRMLNAIGLSAQQAYSMFTKAGFIVRLVNCYNPDTDIPVGYCYEQEVPAGQLHRLGTSFFIWIQAEKPKVKLSMPGLTGRSEGEIRQLLGNMGFSNVEYVYEYSDSATPAGYCIGQSVAAGSVVFSDDYVRVVIKLEPVPIVTPEPSAPPEPSVSTEPSLPPEPTALPEPSVTP